MYFPDLKFPHGKGTCKEENEQIEVLSHYVKRQAQVILYYQLAFSPPQDYKILKNKT